MKWETNTAAQPERRSSLSTEHNEASLLVTNDGVHRWQGLTISFGKFSSESHDACCLTWPREAIARARKLLDELEAKLEEPT